jgi:tRNA (guanine-N7-)-methyltransferase
MEARRATLRAELARIIPEGARFVWEIGCGHGHFLAAYAAAHRDRLCVGVDQDIDRIRRATRKQVRARLASLHFVRAEARMFLEMLPPGASLAAIYVLFPDPWPKRRHHKNRLLQPDFLRALAVRAGEGTPLFFRTDHEPYFREVEADLRADPLWQPEPGTGWPFEEATVFQNRATAHLSLVARRRA